MVKSTVEGHRATTISASDAKKRFLELMDRVANGEEIIITRRGKGVAHMLQKRLEVSPVRPNLKDVRRAVAGLRRLQKQIAARNAGKEPLTWEDMKSMINEGRR
jgi:antitoxin (DNA-binding transcriptional repressor) of toxin-antitoxin stability system